MFFEGPRVDVWVAMEFPPILEALTILTSVAFISYSIHGSILALLLDYSCAHDTLSHDVPR